MEIFLLPLRQSMHFLYMGCATYKKVKCGGNNWEPFLQPSSKLRSHKWELKFVTPPPPPLTLLLSTWTLSTFCWWQGTFLIKRSDSSEMGPLLGHEALSRLLVLLTLLYSQLPVWSEARRGLSRETGGKRQWLRITNKILNTRIPSRSRGRELTPPSHSPSLLHSSVKLGIVIAMLISTTPAQILSEMPAKRGILLCPVA